MALTSHNVEQSGRGHAMYELARRGYVIQFTDSRFPVEDLLVVSPSGRHFGVDVKAQRTKNFWRMKEPPDSAELFYFLTYIDAEGGRPQLYIVPAPTMKKLWHEYKDRMEADGPRSGMQWGVNWTTPHPYLDNWDALPD